VIVLVSKSGGISCTKAPYTDNGQQRRPTVPRTIIEIPMNLTFPLLATGGEGGCGGATEGTEPCGTATGECPRTDDEAVVVGMTVVAVGGATVCDAVAWCT
jgi:hypothetical protein